jgi:hypothetical protein
MQLAGKVKWLASASDEYRIWAGAVTAAEVVNPAQRSPVSLSGMALHFAAALLKPFTL